MEANANSAVTNVLQGGVASMWQVESQTITQGGAVAFLIIASGSLLLLYFFLDKAFYVILVSLTTECSFSHTHLSRRCHTEVSATQSGI